MTPKRLENGDILDENGDIDFRFIINNLKYFRRAYWVDNLFISHHGYLFDI